ncbi:fungal zn(2)-Cys(6) binuclear cluster domain-containing protein [Sarocladium implicatum]|nr:fungal zn(2)-Cys(6) binuclear cluster domain-containing protein [Sarocladium implicatum]
MTSGKRRHVKCDEAKPYCERCIRWRGYCEGYDPIQARASRSRDGSEPESDPGPRTLPDSNPVEAGIASPELDIPIDPLLEMSLVDHPGMGRSNSLPASLDGLQHLTPESTEADQQHELNESFWTERMPHILRDRLDVLYANLAIHAIALSRQPPPHSHLGRPYDAEAMRQRAFTYYGEALRRVGTAPLSKEEVRRAIACSLFFIVFEMCNDDPIAAQSHFRSGQRMADELYSASAEDEQERSFPSGALDMGWELHNVLVFLRTQERTGNMRRWRNGLEAVGRDWLGRNWTNDENWAVDTPLLELAMVKLAPSVQVMTRPASQSID